LTFWQDASSRWFSFLVQPDPRSGREPPSIFQRTTGHPPHTFVERLRHIAEEATLTIIVLLFIAGVHWVAETVHVEQRTLLRHLRISDFLDLAHAANMARLVLFSFGLRI